MITLLLLYVGLDFADFLMSDRRGQGIDGGTYREVQIAPHRPRSPASVAGRTPDWTGSDEVSGLRPNS
ncbi:hypothetical protein [Actinopolyspora xinjiangensis]|uniref:hypothetical protein n=1 Tax=Actinopolyspora xinjiangensis TaxID=405564 RepID=UPI00147B69B1|nr:hypothetical protein [Actinopolyspora xinjiangensis]